MALHLLYKVAPEDPNPQLTGAGGFSRLPGSSFKALAWQVSFAGGLPGTRAIYRARVTLL
jgi:hypothetical protein